MAQKIIPCGGWYIDENTLSFDENKVLSVVGGGGATGVASFNGRTGAVTPAQGDYTAALVGAVDKAGDTMTGDLDMSGNDVTGVHSVIAEGSTNSGLLFESNGTIVGVVTGGTRSATFTANSIDAYEHRISRVGEPLSDTDAARKQDVDAVQTAVDTVSDTMDAIIDGTEVIPYLPEDGGTLSGPLNMGNNKITMGAIPTETTDVTNKGYVDGVVHVVSDEVDGIIAGTTAITLPVATDVKVGGIKVGAGLEVTEDGTLNVNETSVNIPVATISTVGAVKVGSGLMVTSDGTLSNPSASTITSLPNDIYYDVQPLIRSATQNIATINAMTKQVDGGYLDSSNSGQFTFVGADQTNAGLMVASDKVKLDGIPSPTVEDNDKFLMVSNGAYTLDNITGYLSLDGGTMSADAIIEGSEQLQLNVPDSNESATVGVTPQGVTLVHNTNSAADARIRVIENNVEIEADGTIVSFDPSGVDFGAGIITNISSIGGASNGEIAFENTIDLNNHQAKNVADPTEAQDGATKNYVDSRTGNASTSTRGVVLQATGVTDATSADDIITQFNALLASLRTSGVLQDNT